MSMDRHPDIKQALKRVFGYEAFRPHQAEIVDSILGGRDGFVVMPTGGGKSLCFQLPAHLLPGACVVVSPLISLMKDQVDAAVATGLRAAFLNSTLTARQQWQVVEDLVGDRLDLLYVAPERFAVASFLEGLHNSKLNLFAIDEAHCVSEWGHDFRPDYLNLASLVPTFPQVPVVAFTATATLTVQDDIIARLGLRQPFRVRASFDRPNLFYAVTPKADVDRQILDFVRQRPGESGIVYRTTRKAVDATCAYLVDNGVAALPYHAGMEDADRAANQEAFRRDQVQIVVATIAFGMGIDKPNVRWVVHGDLPKNVESYYQETGRAGRDGDPARCQLFFSAGDAAKIQHFIRQVEDPREAERLQRLLRAMLDYAGSNRCRRHSLLGYFGETYAQESCEHCDVCRGEVETVDATIDAQKLLSAIVRSGQRYGAGHVIDIVCGADSASIRRSGHHDLPTYGVGQDQPKRHWARVLDELICQQCVRRSEEQYATLSLTPKGRLVIRGEKPFKMVQTATRAKTASRQPAAETIPADPLLFELLRAWRRDRAAQMGVPSYVIFADRTLRHLSAAKPQAAAELAAVHGIGDHKLAQFGDDVLAIVRDYLAAHPEAPAASQPPAAGNPSPTAAGTHLLTWQMFDQGLSPEAIASRRGLAPSTIFGHLELAVANGRPLAVDRLVSADLQLRIDAIMEELGADSLGPVVERGAGAFGYGEARIVRALRTASQPAGK